MPTNRPCKKNESGSTRRTGTSKERDDQRKERDGIRTRDHRIRSPTLCPTELRALDAHKPALQEKRIGFYPSNRYSDVTAGSLLSIQMPTGRPTMVRVNSTATFAQTQLSHQPTNTK